MLRQTGSKMCIFVLAFATVAVAKPPPPAASPWASFGKPVFSRSVGPPFAAPGMSSITVPYMPKTSPFFPKFVDPKTMISTKTDMLSNLFGGLGPVDYTGTAAGRFSPYPPGYPQPVPVLYATNTKDDIQATNEIIGPAEGTAGTDNMKRGVFGLGGAEFGSSKVSSFPSFSSKFTPFAPAGSVGFPFAGFPSKIGPGFFDTGATTAKSRRSIVTKDDSTKALGPPPAYPGLTPIAEEPDSIESKLLKLYDPALTPKEMLPGMFGPFGPFSAYGVPPVTEIPIPKSTIVPADFWLPSSIIPGPTEYTDKVSSFLSKLFDSLALNKTAPTDDGTEKTIFARSLNEDSTPEKTVVSRSIEDVKTIAAAKDAIIDSILSELGDLKTDMISTLNDFILYQKMTAVAPGAKKTKPISPFAAFFAPPTPDPTLPFKQRMAVLSQVFDMLTGLQKNITLAVRDAIKSSTDAPIIHNTEMNEAVPTKINDFSAGSYPTANSNVNAASSLNATLFDAIKSRLASLDTAIATGINKPAVSYDFQGLVKRDIDDEDYDIPEYYENHHDHDRDQYKRAVQMQIHQGYQSMPPGTIESVQAGGGAVPGHQGGGIKLLNSQKNDEDSAKWSEWAEYYKNQNAGRKHHHNRH